MRIVVASAYVPFHHDRNARLVAELCATLRGLGHQAEEVLLPYRPTDADPIEQALAFRMLDLSDSGGSPIDRLIALGEPAHALRHPHKILWVIGSRRGPHPGYDRADIVHRSEARQVYYAAHQPGYPRGTRVLYPPLLDPAGLEPAEAEPHFVWAGSMYDDSRPELALEAMRFVLTGCGLVMMPEGLTPRAGASLRRRIEEWDLSSRVEVIADAAPAERRRRLQHALGCLCVGCDQEAPEDAVIEAFHARVPVLTVGDSGAPRWMIQHGVNGVNLEPSPRLLAATMNRLAGEPSYRRELGEGAFQSLTRLSISWDYVAESLLA
jgi:hypothetical protein